MMSYEFDRRYWSGIDFRNQWFEESHVIYTHSGWCRADGTIGVTSIASKYPQLEDVLMELGWYISAFPYLNFVVIYTEWDEVPDKFWTRNFDDKPEQINAEINKSLQDYISVGFWVHDKTIEILDPKAAYEKLKEMESLMDSDTLKRVAYWADFHNRPYSSLYLKRCIEGYEDVKMRDIITKAVKEKQN